MAFLGIGKKKKKKEEENIPPMEAPPAEAAPAEAPPSPLVTQIQSYRDQGYNDPQIIQAFQNAGYKPEQIYEAINQANIQQAPPGATPQEGEIPPPPAEEGAPVAGPPVPTEAPAPGAEADMRDKIAELAEVIIDEKWEELIKTINKIIEWKDVTEKRITKLSMQYEEMKNDFENLHKAILGKIADYDKNILTVGTELKAMEKVFQNVLPQLTENISELGRITKRSKK